MCAVQNITYTSDDVIDLVSDDDNNNEDRSMQTLHELCELASLRSLIPPNFLSKSLDSDFNFFNKELALTLLKIPDTKTRSDVGGIPSNVVPLKSNLSTVSSTTAVNTNTKRSIPLQNNNGHISSLQSSSSLKVGRSKKIVKVSRSPSSCEGVTTAKSKDFSERSTKSCTTTNGIIAPSISNSDLTSNLLNKLTTASIVKNAKTISATTPIKSVSYRGFTITPSVNPAGAVNDTPNNTSPEEVRRKPVFNYLCQKCPEKFRYNVALLDHLSTVHGISSNSISSDLDSSSQKSKRSKAKIKKGRLKKLSAEEHSSPPNKIKRNPKGLKTKRKNKNGDGVVAKKALLNVQEPSERLTPEKLREPQTVLETETAENSGVSNPEYEKNKPLSSPLLNGDDTTDDSSLADNLIMDLIDGNSCSNTNDDLQTDFPVDPAPAPCNDLMRSFKFLTYIALESDKGKIYRCSLCRKNFQAIERFLDHFEKNNCCRWKGELKCKFPDCLASSFSSPKLLREHLKTSHNIVTHSCEVCKSYFVREEDLKEHYRLSCITCDNSKYGCPVEGCKVEYFHELHFRSHLSRRHKIITASTCKVCKLFFFKEEELKNHRETQKHIQASVKQMQRAKELKELDKNSPKKKDRQVCDQKSD